STSSAGSMSSSRWLDSTRRRTESLERVDERLHARVVRRGRSSALSDRHSGFSPEVLRHTAHYGLPRARLSPHTGSRAPEGRDITQPPNCGRYPLAYGVAARADCRFAVTPAKVTIRSR